MIKKIGPQRSNLRRNTLLISIVAFFFICLLVIEQLTEDEVVRKNLQVDHVPSELLSYNKLGELFHQLGLINVVPNDSTRYLQDDADTSTNELGPFQKRRQISGTLLTTGRENAMFDEAAGYLENHSEKEGTNIISVVTDKENIRGIDGVITNYQQHGRNWERLAYAAIRSGNELVARTAVGLRLHGGDSRDPTLKYHSYRVYFRKIYGQKWLKTDTFFNEIDQLRTLVIHVDIPQQWSLNNNIANEVYGMIGVPTLEYSEARFLLNGVDQGVFWLSPHLSEKYILDRYGMEKIDYQRYRGHGGNPVYKGDLNKLDVKGEKLTREKVASVLDLDGLVSYFIAVTYSGNTDWNQGVAYRDATQDNALWQWIAWDLDHSFVDWYKGKSENPQRNDWQQKGLPLILEGRMHKLISKRQKVLRRLLQDDPQFREQFAKRYIDTLNHVISVDKLIELYSRYAKKVSEYHQEMNPALLAFFKNRHPHIRYELKHYFSLGDFHELSIAGGQGEELLIDGYKEHLPYTGHYPKDHTVTIAAMANSTLPAGMTINGKPLNQGTSVFTTVGGIHIKIGDTGSPQERQ